MQKTPASRRQVLGGLTTLAGAAAAPAMAAKRPARSVIDVHHHVFPPAQTELRTRYASTSGLPTNVFQRVNVHTPQESLDSMDRNGVRTAFLSAPGPGAWTGDVQESRRLAKAINDFGAQTVADHPGRFGLFASIPLPDIDGSLEAIAYAFDVLKADGIALLTNYDDRWPGDPKFAPVFDELNRRKAVVYFHPTTTSCCAPRVEGVEPQLIEFLFDTSSAITSLLIGGTLTRCRDIRWLFAHGGGTFPMISDRVAQGARTRKDWMARLPHGPEYELRRLNFDTASVANPMSFAAMRAQVPISQIFFGTDFPYYPIETVLGGLHKLGLSPAEQAAVEHGNALRWFPRLSA